MKTMLLHMGIPRRVGWMDHEDGRMVPGCIYSAGDICFIQIYFILAETYI